MKVLAVEKTGKDSTTIQTQSIWCILEILINQYLQISDNVVNFRSHGMLKIVLRFLYSYLVLLLIEQ